MNIPRSYPVPAGPMQPTPLTEDQQIDVLLTRIHQESPLRMFDDMIGLTMNDTVNDAWARDCARKAIRQHRRTNSNTL